jgi:hypothetical protein
MKNLKMRTYAGFDGNFNTNRDVLMYINENDKTVTVFLPCGYDEALEKINKAVNGNGRDFRGYTFIAESPAFFARNITLWVDVPL